MIGHRIYFYGEIWLILPKISLLPGLTNPLSGCPGQVKIFAGQVKYLARSPASRLAADFLVSCQPAVTSAKVSCQPAGSRPKSLLPASYWNTNK